MVFTLQRIKFLVSGIRQNIIPESGIGQEIFRDTGIITPSFTPPPPPPPLFTLASPGCRLTIFLGLSNSPVANAVSFVCASGGRRELVAVWRSSTRADKVNFASPLLHLQICRCFSPSCVTIFVKCFSLPLQMAQMVTLYKLTLDILTLVAKDLGIFLHHKIAKMRTLIFFIYRS